MGPSGCGKTCLSKSLVLDHLDELFVNPTNVIHYCYGALQDGFREMQEEGFKFHESVPEQGQLKKLFPKEGGFLALDVLMTEGGNNKEVLDRFTKHSIITQRKYAKSISRNAHYVIPLKHPQEFIIASISYVVARYYGSVPESYSTPPRISDLRFTSCQ